ncbi:MAG: UDP-N-acetylenolpyruvoylglucosamine reductase [Chlamydiae bacterium]|nr:UDP-N-acetylenolpyruvoylglucosamine reductase [Chlamydiota bacterium]
MLPFQKNKSLKHLSTFKIGGNARLFTEVSTIEELQSALSYAEREGLSFLLVGKGSNSLFHDRGFNGLVIHNKISFFDVKGTEISVGAGYSFSLLGAKTAKSCLSGLEFAAGIPGSVGGAVFMNAGANGGETADALTEVTFVTREGTIQTFSREELYFSYRKSPFQNMLGGIAAARFSLSPSNDARKTQKEIISYRTKTQPYSDLSCGCVFRNPEGKSAGALIEKCGLKGVRKGGAEVSTLHANFIVNRVDATAEDVVALAQHVQESVKRDAGVELEMELRTIPYE